MRLAGHHAVVTGGGTGIGAAIARALAAEGAKLTVIGRRPEPLAAVREEIGAAAITADLTDPAQVDLALAAARNRSGAISILIANAGAAATGPISKTSNEQWHSMIASNLNSVFYCTRAALSDLCGAQSGRIVAVASTAALKGYAYSGAYAAAKHGVLGLIRSLALELADTKVTANALCPGFTDTDIVARAIETIGKTTGRDAETARAALTRFNPQKRLIDPCEVAEAAVWLCLPGSASISGQAISVSGGETM
jgi:NAD(P)-dependent dehydrogenase (short-subunit alcohol dehydrogenase family)